MSQEICEWDKKVGVANFIIFIPKVCGMVAYKVCESEWAPFGVRELMEQSKSSWGYEE